MSVDIETLLCVKVANMTMSRHSPNTVKQALRTAQDDTDGNIDPQVLQILEEVLALIWRKVQRHPNSYVMSEVEFGIFNRYRARQEFQNDTARKAVARYWNSRSAVDGSC